MVCKIVDDPLLASNYFDVFAAFVWQELPFSVVDTYILHPGTTVSGCLDIDPLDDLVSRDWVFHCESEIPSLRGLATSHTGLFFAHMKDVLHNSLEEDLCSVLPFHP